MFSEDGVAAVISSVRLAGVSLVFDEEHPARRKQKRVTRFAKKPINC